MAIKTITMSVSELATEQGATRWDGLVNDFEHRARSGDLIPQFQLNIEAGLAIGTFMIFKIDGLRNAPMPATQEEVEELLKKGDAKIARNAGVGGPRGIVR